MILRLCLVFLFLTCAKTSEDAFNRADSAFNLDSVYNNLPPSSYITRLKKREADLLPQNSKGNTEIKTSTTDLNVQHVGQASSLQKNGSKNEILPEKNEESLHDGLSEGGIGKVNVNSLPVSSIQPDANVQNITNITSISKGNITKLNDTHLLPKMNSTATNTTSTISSEESSLEVDNPGVVKRGLIVFGGFSLLAVAYFIFYRKKNKNYDGGNSHNSNDANQFRYGVLQSDDRRDNLELSRIPLTMESDEDEDEDLEIFDLEQKKKSLSYVNLQTNDEDIVLRSSKDESKNNLLLDIEDGPSDTFINWSNNDNKSIL